MEDTFGIYINVLCPKLTVILSPFFYFFYFYCCCFGFLLLLLFGFLVRSSKPPHLKDLRPAS